MNQTDAFPIFCNVCKYIIQIYLLIKFLEKIQILHRSFLYKQNIFLIYYNCITANSMTNEMRRMYVNKTFVNHTYDYHCSIPNNFHLKIKCGMLVSACTTIATMYTKM